MAIIFDVFSTFSKVYFWILSYGAHCIKCLNMDESNPNFTDEHKSKKGVKIVHTSKQADIGVNKVDIEYSEKYNYDHKIRGCVHLVVIFPFACICFEW